MQAVDGTTQSYDYNRGRITALGNGQLTILRADGQSATLTYGDSTIVRDKGDLESVSDLKVGEGAMFFSQSGALDLVRCIAKPDGQHGHQGNGQNAGLTAGANGGANSGQHSQDRARLAAHLHV